MWYCGLQVPHPADPTQRTTMPSWTTLSGCRRLKKNAPSQLATMRANRRRRTAPHRHAPLPCMSRVGAYMYRGKL